MTRTIVQKFGGTSVADPQKIMACARRVAATREEGHEVVVVSAMGQTTDELIDLAETISDSPSKREMDMLMSTGEQVSSALMAIALQSPGVDAAANHGRPHGRAWELCLQGRGRRDGPYFNGSSRYAFAVKPESFTPVHHDIGPM